MQLYVHKSKNIFFWNFIFPFHVKILSEWCGPFLVVETEDLIRIVQWFRH